MSWFLAQARAVLPSTQATPLLRSAEPAPVAEPALVPVNCAEVACLALTFDDGPDPVTTNKILDTLTREGVHGTFFIVGSRVPGNEEIIRRIYREGNELGNHTWSHADLTKLSPSQVAAQIDQTQLAIMAAGVPAPQLFRAPYGAVSPKVHSHARLTMARWNIDPEDWKYRDPAKIAENIRAQLRPGGIILLHDLYPPTTEALDILIPELKKHYQLVTLSQLLQFAPGTQGEYFGR